MFEAFFTIRVVHDERSHRITENTPLDAYDTLQCLRPELLDTVDLALVDSQGISHPLDTIELNELASYQCDYINAREAIHARLGELTGGAACSLKLP